MLQILTFTLYPGQTKERDQSHLNLAYHWVRQTLNIYVFLLDDYSACMFVSDIVSVMIALNNSITEYYFRYIHIIINVCLCKYMHFYNNSFIIITYYIIIILFKHTYNIVWLPIHWESYRIEGDTELLTVNSVLNATSGNACQWVSIIITDKLNEY